MNIVMNRYVYTCLCTHAYVGIVCMRGWMHGYRDACMHACMSGCMYAFMSV